MSYRKYWLACVICKEKDYHILKEKASQSERERERERHTHTQRQTDRQTDRQRLGRTLKMSNAQSKLILKK